MAAIRSAAAQQVGALPIIDRHIEVLTTKNSDSSLARDLQVFFMFLCFYVFMFLCMCGGVCGCRNRS